jgi:hypothetical protein
VNSPPPKPEVILTNFFAEPTVLLVPITNRARWSTKLNNNNKRENGMMLIMEIDCVIYMQR